jgi:transposase
MFENNGMNMIKPNWDIFKAKFSENPENNFEWFCYLLFCKQFNKPLGIHRYKNQSAIETDPIEVNGELVGWQAKFYETTLSEHKSLLIAICFDEISLHRGHGKFVLVISAPELGLVLDILPDRSKETLLKWLEERGIEWCAAVQYACSDMWDAYQQVAEQKLPNARRVVDRFHVMKNLNDALTKARRTIQKDADEKTKELLKGCRWLLVKNRENLTQEQEKQLAGMLEASPELKQCYELKEAFRDLFNQNLTPKTAEKRLRRWIAKVEATSFKSLMSFVNTLRNWWQQSLNYFDGRFNNGFAEGVNLKIKMLNRRGYGYHNFNSFRLHVLVAFDPISR